MEGLKAAEESMRSYTGRWRSCLLIMLAFSVGSVDTDKWMPFLYDSGMDFLGSTYLVFGIFSWIIFLLFLRPHCAEPEKLGNTAARAVLVTGGLLFFIYLLLMGIFGTKALAGTQFSVVALMSMVELPGRFLERLDVLMVGIWFFALYALMDHMIFHSVNIFMHTFSLKNKKYPSILILILVYAIARGCWESLFFFTAFKTVVLSCKAVPISIGISILAYILVNAKGGRSMHKKRKMFFMLMVLSLLLCGCGDHELENRSFPLAVGLESEKQGCRVVFNFPVLSEVANENADGSYTAVASKKGRDFFYYTEKLRKKTALRVSTFLITKH